MIIKNALVYTKDHRFEKKDVRIRNERITEIAENGQFTDPDENVIDGEGLYAIPGLVDIHFHGCKGADMCDGTKEALDVITSYEASVGVTSVCPATMTIPKDELLEVMKNAGSYEYSGGSHLVGINMEGPFISRTPGTAYEPAVLHGCISSDKPMLFCIYICISDSHDLSASPFLFRKLTERCFVCHQRYIIMKL